MCVTCLAALLWVPAAKSRAPGPLQQRPTETIRDYGAALAFSPDRRILAIGTTDTVRLWQVATGEKLSEAETGSDGKGPCRFLAFSADGKKLLGMQEGRRLDQPCVTTRVWNVSADEKLCDSIQLQPTEHDGWSRPSAVYYAAFSPDAKSITSGSSDGTIHIWDAATGRERLHFSGGVAATFSSDGRSILSVSHDGNVQWFEAESGRSTDQKGEIKKRFIYVDRVAFASDRKTVAVCDPYTVELIDVASNATLQRIGLQRVCASLGFSPDSELLVLGEYQEGIWFLDSRKGTDRRWLDRSGGYHGPVAFSQDGLYVAWCEDDTTSIRETSKVLAGPGRSGRNRSSPGNVSLTTELTANKRKYALDVGRYEAWRLRTQGKLNDPGTPPDVDLKLRVRNTGDKPITIREPEEAATLYLVGDGAMNYPRTLDEHTAESSPREERRFTLGAGESRSVQLTSLKSFTLRSYWILPGQYMVHAVYCVAIYPCPDGADDAGEGFGYVIVRSEPVSVRVMGNEGKKCERRDERPADDN
jgi:WD40 repeat protein